MERTLFNSSLWIEPFKGHHLDVERGDACGFCHDDDSNVLLAVERMGVQPSTDPTTSGYEKGEELSEGVT